MTERQIFNIMEISIFLKSRFRHLKAAAVAVAAVLAGCAELGLPEENANPGVSEGDGRVTVRFEAREFGATRAMDDNIGDLVIAVYWNGILDQSISVEKGNEAELRLTAGRTYTYFASANTDEYEVPDEESQIKKLKTSVSPGKPTGSFPMSAFGTFSVDDVSPEPVTVLMRRLFSKMRFKVDFSDVPDLEITDARIRQASSSVSVFQLTYAAETGDGDYATASDLAKLNSGGEAVLYVPENIQGILLPESAGQWDKIPENIPGKKGVCTYLEVSGRFSGENKLNGEVKYRFYLGRNATNDFNIPRNTDFTVELIPTRDAITRPSWKIDSDNVYADVPFIGMNSSGHVFHWDGISSESILISYPLDWKKVIRGNGLYAAVGEYRNAGASGISADGKDWELDDESFMYPLTDIAYGNGLYVAVAEAGTIYLSSDGRRWDMAWIDGEPSAIAFGNGRFVMMDLSGNSWSSTDGRSWQKARIHLYASDLCFADGQFFIIGRGTSYKIMQTSPDGLSWKTSYEYKACHGISDIVYGDGIYVMSTESTILYSMDGLTWNESGADIKAAELDYRDGVFLAGYGSGLYTVYATSLDGRRWTEIGREYNRLKIRTVCLL